MHILLVDLLPVESDIVRTAGSVVNVSRNGDFGLFDDGTRSPKCPIVEKQFCGSS